MAENKRSIVPLERRLIKHDFKTLESALSVNFASSYFSEDCSVYASELEDESASQPSDLVLLAEAVDNDHIRTRSRQHRLIMAQTVCQCLQNIAPVSCVKLYTRRSA